MTQIRLAEILDKNQVVIAQKMEKRSDMLLSILRSYVEAMGGYLDLVVQFPDREPVVLQGLGEDFISTSFAEMPPQTEGTPSSL